MRNLIFFIICLALTIFQLSVLGVFFSYNRLPDLILVFVIALVIQKGLEESLKWIVILGLLIDAGSHWLCGTSALVFLILGALFGALSEVTGIKTRKTLLLFSLAPIIAIFKIASDAAVIFLSKLENYWLGENFPEAIIFFSWDYVLKLTYTVLAGYLIYFLLKRVDDWLLSFEPVEDFQKK